jgi:hypothetical protein
MTVTNSDRMPRRTRSLKGIQVNSTKYTDLAERSQTSTCPELFGKFAPRKNSPDAEGDIRKSPPSPTGGEAHHG